MKKESHIWSVLTLVMGMTLLSLPYAAQAIVITFDDAGSPSGSIFYDGNGGGLTGTGIALNSLVATATLANNNVELDCVGCTLSFVTGDNILQPTSGVGLWQFSAGGSFTLTGGVDYDNGSTITNIVSPGSTLLTGYFTDVINLPSVTGGGVFGSFSGYGLDTKNEDLLSFYGAAPDVQFSFQAVFSSLNGCTFTSGGEIDCSIQSAIVSNIPSPGPVLLIGFGLVLMWRVRAKQKSYTN